MTANPPFAQVLERIQNEPVGTYAIFIDEGWPSVFVKDEENHWKDISPVKSHPRGVENGALAGWLSGEYAIVVWSLS